MRTRELFLQGCFFTISCLTLLFLLSIAECLALFKVAQFLWRWSTKAAIVLVRILHPSKPSTTF
jgi:hypothetical protein